MAAMRVPGWQRIERHIHPRLDPDARYGLRLTLMVVAFSLIAVPFGFLLVQVTSEGFMTEIDRHWSGRFYAISQSSTTAGAALEAVSFIGKPIFLVLVVGIPAVWLTLRGERRIVVYLIATAVTGGFVDTIIKSVVGRPRPSYVETAGAVHGTSFPSGHSLASVVCYGAMVLVALPYLGRRGRLATITAAVVVVLLVGFSRLALGYHFLSDVLAGYAFGFAWLIVATAVFSAWRTERHEPEVHLDVEGIEPVHDAGEHRDEPTEPENTDAVGAALAGRPTA